MAALIKNNVQTGTIAFGATDLSNTATITSVDTSKCFIIIEVSTDVAGSGTRGNNFRGVLTNSTTITVDRTDDFAGAATARWWAVEFSSGLTVRHFTGTSRNTNVAIGATVDLSKTFGILSNRTNSFGAVGDTAAWALDIVSTTQFQVKVAAGTQTINWGVQIIEFDSDADPVVEAVTITVAALSANNSGTVGAVTIADSMIIGSATVNDSGNYKQNHLLFEGQLTSTTNLQLTRSASAGTPSVTWYMFVIDWGANVDIRNGTGTLTSAEGLSETQAITALVSTGDAIAFFRAGCIHFGSQGIGGGGGSEINANVAAEISLDSTTQITITRGQADSGQDIQNYFYQVIDFSGFVAAIVTERTAMTPFGVVVHVDENKDSMTPFGFVVNVDDFPSVSLFRRMTKYIGFNFGKR